MKDPLDNKTVWPTKMNHPLIRYHGGKFRLADWIIGQFPQHETYVEPFGGGASVLLSKTPSKTEIYNDLDSDVVNFFQVLRCDKKRLKLIEQIELTPYSRIEFLNAYSHTECEIEKARRLVIRSQMGFGSAGATKGRTGFRATGGRDKPYEAILWADYPLRLIQAAKRLKSVYIENDDALRIIQQYDSSETLFFIDPPYLCSTRDSGTKAYKHDLTDDQHAQLLELILSLKGKVILSGYQSDLYEQKLKGWRKLTKPTQACGANGGVSREEVLWINPQAEKQGDLFSEAV